MTLPEHMPTIAHTHIPLPKAWDEFEEITLSATRLRWGFLDFFRNGRRGQRQDGVDIFGTPRAGYHVGIQCKNTVGGISLPDVLTAVNNAASFKPPLAVLYIATTAEHDGRLQEKVRNLSDQRRASGEFAVEILFWSDISGDLAKDADEFFKHYPEFKPDTEGQAPGEKSVQSVFTADEMAMQRHPAFGGRSISMHTLLQYGLPLVVVGLGGMLYTIFRPFAKSGGSTLVPFVSMIGFCFGMTAVAISLTLKKRRFEHLWGRFYLEATEGNRLCINKLSATCPWCGKQMHLRSIGPKDGPKDDLFLCERNPRQHSIHLDPTCLPEIQ